jgi:hypothetical protein
LRILLQYGAYKLTSASLPRRSKKGVQDTACQLQAPTPGVGQTDLVGIVTTMLPFSPQLKREEAKTK